MHQSSQTAAGENGSVTFATTSCDTYYSSGSNGRTSSGYRQGAETTAGGNTSRDIEARIYLALTARGTTTASTTTWTTSCARPTSQGVTSTRPCVARPLAARASTTPTTTRPASLSGPRGRTTRATAPAAAAGEQGWSAGGLRRSARRAVDARGSDKGQLLTGCCPGPVCASWPWNDDEKPAERTEAADDSLNSSAALVEAYCGSHTWPPASYICTARF